MGADETAKRLTRREAAAKIGCAESTIRRAEAAGELTPYTDHHGVTRYPPVEVARMAARRIGPGRDGDVAALAFRMFREGASIDAIVIETARTPGTIRALHAEWLSLREADVNAPLPKAAAR